MEPHLRLKLDYQLCSLIPPATAISKTQEPIKHTNEYIQSFFDWKLLSANITQVQC